MDQCVDYLPTNWNNSFDNLLEHYYGPIEAKYAPNSCVYDSDTYFYPPTNYCQYIKRGNNSGTITLVNILFNRHN